MGYASKLGRAKINSRSPQAAGRCDGCGFIFSRSALRPQLQWAGNKLINLKQLVCRRCNDIPQTQLRAIVLPADPMPVLNPRPENYIWASTDYRATSGQNTVDPLTNIPIPGNTLRITENDDYRVTQQTGGARGSLNELPGTDPNAVTYRNISGAVDNGSGLIRLTVDTTNGMITGQRVTVGGVDGTTEANNNWTITVISLTEIDLQGSVFTNAYSSGGYVVNNPALPYGAFEIPKTGTL